MSANNYQNSKHDGVRVAASILKVYSKNINTDNLSRFIGNTNWAYNNGSMLIKEYNALKSVYIPARVPHPGRVFIRVIFVAQAEAIVSRKACKGAKVQYIQIATSKKTVLPMPVYLHLISAFQN